MNLSPTIIYDLATGEIKSTGSIQVDAEFLEQQTAAALAPWGADVHGIVVSSVSADPARHYVVMLGDRAVVAERPELVVSVLDDRTTLQAGGVDAVTLTGLPDPCEIIVDDPDPDVETAVHTVSGGGFVFVAQDPGVYTVEVRRWPFLPFKIEFTAL